MNDGAPAADLLASQVKHFIVDSLGLKNLEADRITDDEPLIGGRIGLDSVDALEIALGLEENFGIVIRSLNEFHGAFASVDSLTGFIRNYGPASPVGHEPVLPLELSARW